MYRARMQRRQGFTLVELLVVIAILAILAGLLLPTLARGKSSGRGIVCLNNVKQLTLAWYLYASENDDRVVAAADFQQAPNWCEGWLDFALGHPENFDIHHDLTRSPLYPYCASPDTFRCPEDKTGRVRTMAMNGWMGGPAWASSGSDWLVHRSTTQILDPASRFVFIDEREDSINDGYFVVDMKGYPNEPAARKIGSYPGSYHRGAAAISFADGHAVLNPWKDTRTKPPLINGKALPLNISSPENPDVRWLQEAATQRSP